MNSFGGVQRTLLTHSIGVCHLLETFSLGLQSQNQNTIPQGMLGLKLPLYSESLIASPPILCEELPALVDQKPLVIENYAILYKRQFATTWITTLATRQVRFLCDYYMQGIQAEPLPSACILTY